MRTIASHIEVTPGVCDGKPRIAGHDITVADVVIWHEEHASSCEEIAAKHPGITLADVHAALAYYFDHQAEIRQDIEEEKQQALAKAG